MNVQQLIELLIQNGYERDSELPGLITYDFGKLQATWVDLNEGYVGANLFGEEGQYEIGTYYDLNDPTECYDCYVEAISYQFQIANPTVTQAIRIQHGAKEMFKMLESIAPGRFTTPSIM